MPDSTLSKTSGDVFIAKTHLKRTRKDRSKEDYRNRQRVSDDGTEEQKDSFKWIPNPSESFFTDNKDIQVSTLESTSSSYTTSDFTSHEYSRNGYIRGNSTQPLPLLKYNEFSSLVSSLGTAGPVEINFNKENPEKQQKLDELGTLLITGGTQMLLGVLMAVFGILIIVYDASLAGAGGGLWGGAVAIFSGLLGVIAGLKACYSSEKENISPSLLTAYLAMCLISFALSNLVLVLTVTGLIRDINLVLEDESLNWPPILSDSGLIVTSLLQCIFAIIAGYKCYRKICPCLRSRHSRLQESDSNLGTTKLDGKEKLVSHWLGQQFTMKKNRLQKATSVPWGTPNIVLLPPPPTRFPTGPVPLWTFLHPTAARSVSSNSHQTMYSCPPLGIPPPSYLSQCCCHHDNLIYSTQPVNSKIRKILPDEQVKGEKKKSKRERRLSVPTSEDLARTYTGLDREIAEEFIAISMDKGRRRSRANSISDYSKEFF